MPNEHDTWARLALKALMKRVRIALMQEATSLMACAERLK